MKALADWADGILDPSEIAVILTVPDAVKAIHDATFATPPADWIEYAYRLQYLAEMHVGTRLRQAQAREDALVEKAKRAAGST